MKILHLINGEHYAGAERVQDLLALELKRQGYDIEFASLKTGAFAQFRMCHDAPLYMFSMRSRLDLMPLLKLRALIIKTNPKVIHAHTPRTLLLGYLVHCLTKVPLVYHVHSPTDACTSSVTRNFIVSFIERITFSGVSKMLCVSDAMGAWCREKKVNDKKIVIVKNGIQGPDTLPDLSVVNCKPVIGVIALFRRRKGLDVLLRAGKNLQKSGCNFIIRVVGKFEDSEYEREIHGLVEQLGLSKIVEFIGFQSDVSTQLSRFTVMAVPSLYGEGLPMVLLEAMAHGIPIVASKVEGIPEALRDKEDGLLVDPGNVESLACALKLMLNDETEREKFRRAAFLRYRKEFSAKMMADKVAKIYEDVLHESY